jgi:hypothetical protein
MILRPNSRRPLLPRTVLGLLAILLLMGACSLVETATPSPAAPSPAALSPEGSATPKGLPVSPTSAQATLTPPARPEPSPQSSQPVLPTASAGQQSPLRLYLPLVVMPGPPTPVPPTEVPPTPTLAWPEPLSGQTGSKLGLHVIAISNDSFVLEFVQRVHPRVINAPADPEGLAKVKAVSPSTVTLSRVDVAGQNVWVDTVPDAAAAAEHYVAVNLQTYKQNPGVDYWLGINEFNPQSVANWNWFTTFEATRACAMQAQGLHAAIGDFAVGWPNSYDQMTLFLPALEAAHRCGAIFSVHEYNGPTLDCGVGVNTPGIIPGAPALGVPAGPLTLRYRFWYESFLKPRHLDDVPLVVTELATLGGPFEAKTCGGQGDMTWKAYQQSWIQRGFGATGLEAYIHVLAWYDAELRKDPYVLGAAIFTSGEFYGGAWWAFDMHDALIPLARYEAQLKP